jgi:hypothetical protein
LTEGRSFLTIFNIAVFVRWNQRIIGVQQGRTAFKGLKGQEAARHVQNKTNPSQL